MGFVNSRVSTWTLRLATVAATAALLAGCQALPVKVLAKAMDNAQTEENVKYLRQYADEHIRQEITVQADLAYGELPSQRLDVVYPAQRAQAKLPVNDPAHKKAVHGRNGRRRPSACQPPALSAGNLDLPDTWPFRTGRPGLRGPGRT